ncbi:MAG: hypothetical protein JKY93_12705 [Gammaproteobacteria bacterium]|nr:hypothetical protein [Gammaproteobacteria bacterium]
MMQPKRFSGMGLAYAFIALAGCMLSQTVTLMATQAKTQQRNLTIELQQLALADTLIIERKEKK